jgi:small subunit ribosomal protein S6
MAFYESVFIIRQDVSSNDVDKITNEFTQIIKDNNSEVVKTEYWGLRNLAYEIANNKKGHYVFLGICTNNISLLPELDRRMKLNANIIRFMHIAVDAISDAPSPILRSQNYDNEQTIDVTD